MSNRTLLELNHDFCPPDSELLDWAKEMKHYMQTGDKMLLPRGVSFLGMRHHDDPFLIRQLVEALDEQHDWAMDEYGKEHNASKEECRKRCEICHLIWKVQQFLKGE